MSKIKSFFGVLKMTASMAREEWNETDKKFYKLFFGALGFALSAAFWFFFMRHITPF